MTEMDGKIESDPAGWQRPDSLGRFGKFGGKYVPETLMSALTELESAFYKLANDLEFQVCFCCFVVKCVGSGLLKDCFFIGLC